jgi:hypothetical protein
MRNRQWSPTRHLKYWMTAAFFAQLTANRFREIFQYTTRNLRLPSKFLYPPPQLRYLPEGHDIIFDIIGTRTVFVKGWKGTDPSSQAYFLAFAQQVRAALLAISARRFSLSFAARFGPPIKPPLRVYSLPESSGVSETSPRAIRITRTALPITSAGLFWPWGPFGMIATMAGRRSVPSC